MHELNSDVQTDCIPSKGAAMPKESNATVNVKVLKGKETKNEQTVSTQQMIDELRTELKQILSAVLEARPRPPAERQRGRGCQKCRDEGAGENCSHCFKCGQDGHFSHGCRAGKQARTAGAGSTVVQNRESHSKQRQVSFFPPETVHKDTEAAANTIQYLPSKHQSQLVGLVGRRCIVNCHMVDHPVKVLWDTGAQSCIINDSWHQRHLPHTVIRPIAELLENDTLTVLTVLAANDTPIPYIDWIEVSFQLDDERDKLQIPILVSGDPAVASDAIVGYIIIEAVINGEERQTQRKNKNIWPTK